MQQPVKNGAQQAIWAFLEQKWLTLRLFGANAARGSLRCLSPP